MLALVLALALQDPEIDAALETLRRVGREGEGHEAAAVAWRAVVAKKALLPALRAFDGASPRAANWLRTAVDTIATAGGLDAPALEAFVRDAARDGEARKLAFDWLTRADPAAPRRLLPDMLDDPGRELRREAVALALDRAGPDLDAIARILPSARDRDQVDAIAQVLKKGGRPVDLRAHYGLLTRWTLIAPFDNKGMQGFDVAYPPERGTDAEGARSVETASTDPLGVVDLNAVLGKEKGVVAYARAVADSPEERPVEVRAGTNNAVKIFLNGELLFFRNEYHHGMKMDQYVGRGRLRKGRNEVLLKICQNEQTEDWAQKWSFQARLCDALGGGVPFTQP